MRWRQTRVTKTSADRRTNLRLVQHVEAPGAESAVCRNGDQVVRVLGADNVHAVDWVSVGMRAEVTALYGRALGPVVPQHNLARIGASHDNVGLEGRKLARQHSTLRRSGEGGAADKILVSSGDDILSYSSAH